MAAFLLIRRKKTSLFLDIQEDKTVVEIKRKIEGILGIRPKDQQLITMDNKIMKDDYEIMYYGIGPTTTLPFIPMELILACRQPNGKFETPEIVPYSKPTKISDSKY